MFSLSRLRNNQGKFIANRSLTDRRNPKASREIGFRELGFTLNFTIDHRRSHVPSIFSAARSGSGRIPTHASRPATDATGCNAQRENHFPIDALLQESRVGGRTRWRGLIILSIGQAVLHVEQLTKHLRISSMQNAIRRFTYTQHLACILMVVTWSKSKVSNTTFN